jgi:hypothetical protein
MGTFSGRVDGAPAFVEVRPDALVVDGSALAWVDLDHVEVDGHRVSVATADGRAAVVSHLATAFDPFVGELVDARARARRAALLQWTGENAIEVFDAKRGTERVKVHLFPDGLTVEPLTGTPDLLPLSCIVEVERNGYDLTLRARGVPDVHVRHLGNRTDELLQRLDRAVAELRARTADAYRQLDPALATLDAADGWAVDAATAGPCWEPLRRAVAGQRRAAHVDALAALAGDRLRLGIKCGPGAQATLPFALAPVGDRVAVEATDADDRATFVFATGDVDRLNAVLLATSFRREAISLPADRLGRWALAVRTLEVVRWARAALVARVVHDDRWEPNVRDALAG